MTRLDHFDQLLYRAYAFHSDATRESFLERLSPIKRQMLRWVVITDTEQGIVRRYLADGSIRTEFDIDRLVRRMRSSNAWRERHNQGIEYKGEGFFPVILGAEGVYTFTLARNTPERPSLEDLVVDFANSGEKECVIVWTYGGKEKRSEQRTYLSSIPGKDVHAVRRGARGVLYFREKQLDARGTTVGWLTAFLLIEVSIRAGKTHEVDSFETVIRCFTRRSGDPMTPAGPSTRGLDDTWKRLVRRAKKCFLELCEPVARDRLAWMEETLRNTRELDRMLRQIKEERKILPSIFGPLDSLSMRLREGIQILMERASRLIDRTRPNYSEYIRTRVEDGRLDEVFDSVKGDLELFVVYRELKKPRGSTPQGSISPMGHVFEELLRTYVRSPERRDNLWRRACRIIPPLDPDWE